MRLHEAVEAALEQGGHIKRPSHQALLKVDEYGTSLCYLDDSRWTPSLDDLTASDWELNPVTRSITFKQYWAAVERVRVETGGANLMRLCVALGLTGAKP